MDIDTVRGENSPVQPRFFSGNRAWCPICCSYHPEEQCGWVDGVGFVCLQCIQRDGLKYEPIIYKEDNP
jgi:hypothetical protein